MSTLSFLVSSQIQITDNLLESLVGRDELTITEGSWLVRLQILCDFHNNAFSTRNKPKNFACILFKNQTLNQIKTKLKLCLTLMHKSVALIKDSLYLSSK